MQIQLAFVLILFLGIIQPSFAQDENKGCVEGNCENGWGISETYLGEIYQGRYEGEFEKGLYAGKGKFVAANGDKYEGSWADGKPNGLGAKTFSDGKIQAGTWEDGKLVARQKREFSIECLVGTCKEGHGKSQDNSGNIYSGDFANGQYSGYGEMNYNNGDRFVGHWENGVHHGKGSYFFNNGHVNTGEFSEGKYLLNKMKVWAVVAGVAEYENFQKLSFTTKDAQRVYAFLRSVEGGAIPEDQITLLLDSEATAFNIVNTAADLYEQADSNDLIIFYFAGHGKNGAFLPYDYDGADGNLLHHGLINSVLKDSPAKYKLCVIDACHSGSFDMNTVVSYKDFLKNTKEQDGAPSMTMTRSTQTVRERIKNYYKSFDGIKGGLAVIMSSASEEISLEANKLQQGVFSYYFIQAMKGAANLDGANGEKDNVIDVKELYKFVERNVRNFTYGFQHPLIYGEYDEHMPIGVLKRAQ
jgi:hypothetical protein